MDRVIAFILSIFVTFNLTYINTEQLDDSSISLSSNSEIFSGSGSGRFCHDPGSIEYGHRQPDYRGLVPVPRGFQLHFACRPGYILDGSNKMVCNSEGSWEPPTKPRCRPVICPIPHVKHGRIIAGGSGIYYPGTTVKVICDSGYRLKDKLVDLIECHLEGLWRAHNRRYPTEMPECVEHTCMAPPQIPNSQAQVDGDFGWDGGYKPNSVVTYNCNDGFQMQDLQGSRLICQNGIWQPENPDIPLSKCVKGGCSRPLPISNGNYVPKLETMYPYHTTIMYYCSYGFTRIGQTLVFQCMPDGRWSPSMIPNFLPQCHHQGTHFHIFHDGRSGSGVYVNHGKQIQEIFQTNPTSTSIFEAGLQAFNQATGCMEPPSISHGHIENINGSGPSLRNTYPENTVVRYTCDPGYSMRDCIANWIICKDRLWVNPYPVCEVLTGCGRPPIVSYALVTRPHGSDSSEHEYPLYSKVHYKCLPGFQLVGTPDLICGPIGCWTPHAPQCISINGPYGSESEWTQTTGNNAMTPHDYDWTESSSQPIVISVVTASTILGVLLFILLLVVFQRRKLCLRCFHHHHHHHHRRRSSSTASLPPCTGPTPPDPDRVALIAFADGVQVVLPTYEEAIRQSGPPPFEAYSGIHRGRSSRNGLPSLPPSRRARMGPPTRDSSTETNHSGGPTRQSSSSSHTASLRSASMADSMGSTDTMTASEVSTTVTLDTLSSNTSNTSQPLSCRAMCGSLASFDTSSVLNTEGVPLLEETENETNEATETNDQAVEDVTG